MDDFIISLDGYASTEGFRAVDLALGVKESRDARRMPGCKFIGGRAA